MTVKRKKTGAYEEHFLTLQDAVRAMKNEDMTLEEAHEHYQKGMESYEECRKILNELKQKVAIYDRRLDELKEAD